MNSLSHAIDSCNLPELINELYPEAGVPARGGLVVAVWRGEKRPSFSVFRRNGVWFFRDHATGESGNAWHFLTTIAGMSKAQARAKLMNSFDPAKSPPPKREKKPDPVYSGPSQASLSRLRTAQANAARGLNEDMKGRGFTPELVSAYRLGREGEDTLIPIWEQGKVAAIKVRLHGKPHKYTYLDRNVGTRPIELRGSGPGILLIEGEFNAIAAHWAMDGEVTVVGMPGANHMVPERFIERWRGAPVYIHTDHDEAGRQAKVNWAKQLLAAGLDVRLMPFDNFVRMDGKIGDFCDRLSVSGKERLKEIITDNMRKAKGTVPPGTPKLQRTAYALRRSGMKSGYKASVEMGTSRQHIRAAYEYMALEDNAEAEQRVALLGVSVAAVVASDWRELQILSLVARGIRNINEISETLGVARQSIYRAIAASDLLRVASGIVTAVTSWKQRLVARAKTLPLTLQRWRRLTMDTYISAWQTLMSIFGTKAIGKTIGGEFCETG